MPTVKSGRLYQVAGESDPIAVGTPSWYTWLHEHASFLFVDHTDVVTVRKNGTDHAESEWKASRTRLGKVSTVSLGPSRVVTLSTLRAAARTLAGKHAHFRSTTLSATRPADTSLPQPVATTGSLRSLMRTKLYRPRSASDVIPRTHLLERLHTALGGQMTLVCAPAGFGKTTLLAQGMQTIDYSHAWLSLDEHDNELPVFLQSLVASLQTALPDAFEATASLLKTPRILPPDLIAPVLINDLADLPDGVILVLDDYHVIHDREVHTLLELLVEHAPPQLHLVLITRSDPPLPVARWLAKGLLIELRGNDLRFSLEETEAFLTRMMGSEAAHETAAVLNERTEGWIAALRLAAISLSQATDRTSFLEHLDSSAARSLSGYLVGEILTQQTHAVQEFLERISFLDQFCAELCVAIMESDISQESAQATLDWLERTNLFLVPLDKRQRWYRFHHLFQELLQQRLQSKSSQEELATLHVRASAWYARHHFIDEAIQHALLAGEDSRARNLVETHFFAAFEQERLTQVEHWLRLLPEEQILGSPYLLAARAWIAQARGHLKELPGLLTKAEQLLASGDQNTSDTHDPSLRLLRGLVATLWSLFNFFSGQIQASLECARCALTWIPPGEEHMLSHATYYLVLANQAAGCEEEALAVLQHALQDHSKGFSSTARLVYVQAYLYLAMGKLSQVEHTARHLLHIAREADLLISQNYAHWLLGLACYEQNQLDEAAYHFSAVIANQHQAHFLVVQDSLCGLALTYQAQGLGAQARETALTSLEFAQQRHSLSELMVAYAFCGRLALLQNEVEQAQQWLEMAGEQEVRGPMFFLVDPPVTAVRMLLARGDTMSIAAGQVLLSKLLQLVESLHNTRKLILVLALQAWAYDLQGRRTEALETLERALDLARPGGFIRTFADIAPLATLLGALRRHRQAGHEVDKHMDSYVHSILAAMEPAAAHTGAKEDLLAKEGLEPLTRRELQILRLLDTDLTNKEIARELVVTTETVKLHTKHVYRKLGVNNRRAAVSLGKALGLLSTS
ncbi:MAG TPA: LuxR C-terminal-related transcriptional regulator [Ktedonobacteraceae bacterium]